VSEIREVLRSWLGGEGLRTAAERPGGPQDRSEQFADLGDAQRRAQAIELDDR